jgi:low temperature requirement protein LtrA
VGRIRRRPLVEEQRASFIELFFDLVFVFAVTQLSARLLADLTVSGAAKTGFLLLVVWWAWSYTTWTTNWFDPDTGPVRAVLLGVMLASMRGAIAIPEAFGDRAMLFVGAYVGVQFARNSFVALAVERDDPLRLPLIRIWAWNSWVGAIWLAGALLDDARVAVWIAALLLDYGGPLAGHWTPGIGRSSPKDWELVPSHFAERVHLFVIIALGESIVVTGATAAKLDVTPGRLLAIVIAVLITAALWWLYFDYHAERAQRELTAAADERGRLGRDLTYLYVPLVAGIIVTAVGNELVVAHPGDELPATELIALAAGPGIYLVGSVAYKLRALRLWWPARLVAAALVAGAALLGAFLPALAVWAIVLAILAGVGALEAGPLRLD